MKPLQGLMKVHAVLVPLNGLCNVSRYRLDTIWLCGASKHGYWQAKYMLIEPEEWHITDIKEKTEMLLNVGVPEHGTIYHTARTTLNCFLVYKL